MVDGVERELEDEVGVEAGEAEREPEDEVGVEAEREPGDEGALVDEVARPHPVVRLGPRVRGAV